MIETCYRNELKYLISKPAQQIMSRRLRTVLKMDPHAGSDGYLVKSVYFDDFDDNSLLDNLMGTSDREKFRIRYYDTHTEFINLEKKVKKQNKGFKEISRLTLDEAERMIKGDIEFLKNHPDSLLREFYLKTKQKGLRAKVIVIYRREPFIFTAGNTRITLDFNIRNSLDVGRFFDPDLITSPQLTDRCLLEVKFDCYLPDIIRDIIQVPETQQTAHSKYGISRMYNL